MSLMALKVKPTWKGVVCDMLKRKVGLGGNRTGTSVEFVVDRGEGVLEISERAL